MSTMQEAYFVASTTGCTCCRDENRAFGPFSSLLDAQQKRDNNRSSRNWASQYATNGRHAIYKEQVEVISDGRIIFGDRVLKEGWSEPWGFEIGHPDEFELYNQVKDAPAPTPAKKS